MISDTMKALNLTTIKKRVEAIPPGLKRFMLRGTLLFIGWRLLYEFVLKPAGTPDNQLIELVLWGTKALLSPFYSDLTSTGYNVFINNQLAITIAKPCNGLELMVMYVGFLICLPSTLKRFVQFALIGILLTISLNMVRCAVLASMFYNHYELADFMHHYLFKLAIYAVNFYLWILYSKKDGLHKA
ncbi:MAG: hypothetical protein EON97_00735 [Chitinophagaceae bacterium]|nr:MAG: hypothetical protein EON97_00735 [Chitinophagaceae bacterium]